MVATYKLADGRQASVLRSDLAAEMAFRMRHAQEGKDALDQIVELHVIDAAARDAQIEVTPAEIQARRAQIDEALHAQDKTLAAYLTDIGLDPKEFERGLRAGILRDHLVMKGLGTDDQKAVTPELTKLWLQQAKKRYCQDAPAASGDVVATVDGQPIHLAELGGMLLGVVSAENRQKHVRRVVLRDLIHREAERLLVKVDEQELRDEITRRRKRIEADPRFRGATYDDWLMQTQGVTVDEFAASPHLRATVEQRRIVELQHPVEELRAMLDKDRKDVLERLGEKRALSAILLRAIDTPNELIKRTPDKAKEDLLALREQCRKGRPFAELARIHSDDPRSKVKGGALGEFPHRTDDLPANIVEAAFALPLFGISDPLPIQGGMAIVRVDTILPPPEDDELIERLRDEAGEKWLASLLESAHIEMVR